MRQYCQRLYRGSSAGNLVRDFHSLQVVELGSTNYASVGHKADTMCRWVDGEEIDVHSQGHTSHIQEVLRAPARRRLARKWLLGVHSVPTHDKINALPVAHGDDALVQVAVGIDER
jgi:hypothetical protein